MTNSFRLPKQPVIYELNTAVFLYSLSNKYGRQISLESVPDDEWKAIASLPVDAVWLMGVWRRSPYSRKLSMKNKDLKETLLDFAEKDNLGSAYSVRSYDVETLFGGDGGLAHAREALHQHGLGLILDYVPNHIACDHKWVRSHPDYLIPGTNEDLRRHPHEFTKTEDDIFANGKDPTFPAWSDVLQINIFSPELRKAAAKTVSKIASQCDGIRCDMAMLVTNQVFAVTWEGRISTTPSTEYWTDVIANVRESYPDCIFIAEVYWNWEHRLLKFGFDYCYDKVLYDRLAKSTSLELFHHLLSDQAYQSRLLRFIENHDEPRAATVFKGPKHHAAAFILATLPGATMYHEGQIEGYKTKLPVHLRRGPEESIDAKLSEFYRQLIYMVAMSHMRDGAWQLRKGSGGFLRSTKLIAWSWTRGADCFICIVNYGNDVAKGKFELPDGIASKKSTIILGGELITPRSVTISEPTLAIELQAWGYVAFRFGA
jgi:hypothetical protein